MSSPRTYQRIKRLTVELDVLLRDVGWDTAFPGLMELLRKLRTRAHRAQTTDQCEGGR